MVGVGKALETAELPIPVIKANEILVRVKAAGICHSDAHYRAGISAVQRKSLTLGHEVAGVVEAVGADVHTLNPGDRVCLHYLVTCGKCSFCLAGDEQFCPEGRMLGHHIDGGYAEYVAIPARNAVRLPESIDFTVGATLMCASATAYHALRKSRIIPGDTVAVYGAGGLGQSAVQLAKAMGAGDVYAIDIDEEKLKIASMYGAIPIHSLSENPVDVLQTQIGGVHIALEMVGLPLTQMQALKSLRPLGKLVLVGLSDQNLSVNTYADILGKEAEIIGSNDHLLHELSELIDLVTIGKFDTTEIVSETIPLAADEINKVLDAMENHTSRAVRTVIVPD